MKEKWVFDGIDLISKDKWGIEEVLEGIGIPGYRGNNLQVPFQHGNRWIKKKFDRRKVTFSMWIKGKDRDELDYRIDEFLKGIGRTGIHPLRRTRRDGSIREAQAELCSEINFVRKNPGYAKFALEFELADPFFYGTNKTVETKAVTANEYSWTHVNTGSAPSTSIDIKLTGPLSNPLIQNMNNGVWLQYLGSIGSGESIIFNTKHFTCLQGNTNMISVVKHGGDPYWMVFENGNNNMKIQSDITGGSIDIEYYPPYY